MRRESSQSLADGSHYQNLYTTSRSGAYEISSDIQQLRHESEHLIVHGRNLENRNASMSKRGSFSWSVSRASSPVERND